MAKFNWKVWLRPNKLTPNPTDFVAEVDTAGDTRRQQDIIDRIIAEGSEVKPETIKAILDRANAVKRDFILAGYGVFDDFIHLTPRVRERVSVRMLVFLFQIKSLLKGTARCKSGTVFL
jgi:hypothetical protein